ncbi:hypothetical protein [Nocardia xishanensis]
MLYELTHAHCVRVWQDVDRPLHRVLGGERVGVEAEVPGNGQEPVVQFGLDVDSLDRGKDERVLDDLLTVSKLS